MSLIYQVNCFLWHGRVPHIGLVVRGTRWDFPLWEGEEGEEGEELGPVRLCYCHGAPHLEGGVVIRSARQILLERGTCRDWYSPLVLDVARWLVERHLGSDWKTRHYALVRPQDDASEWTIHSRVLLYRRWDDLWTFPREWVLGGGIPGPTLFFGEGLLVQPWFVSGDLTRLDLFAPDGVTEARVFPVGRLFGEGRRSHPVVPDVRTVLTERLRCSIQY